jgi:inosine-uridine nucleoside N-ribohydrolase
MPVPPLPLVRGGPVVVLPRRVWIDTDAACGHARTADPDDCLAILLLARSPGVELVGISTVFGNAPLEVTDRTARELADLLQREDVEVPVYRGAALPVMAGFYPFDAVAAMYVTTPELFWCARVSASVGEDEALGWIGRLIGRSTALLVSAGDSPASTVLYCPKVAVSALHRLMTQRLTAPQVRSASAGRPPRAGPVRRPDRPRSMAGPRAAWPGR